MNIIIAGGTGLIGQPLVQFLIERNHRVWVLSRSPQSARLPGNVEAVRWDGKTPQGWQHLVDQADAIINLAGENIGSLPWTNERKLRIRSSRVDAGAAITQAIEAAARKPRVLMQASAIGYYGPHGDEILTEASPAGSDFLSGVAVDWEASTQPVEALGVRRVIARTGIYLTPEGGVLDRFLYPWRMFLGGPMGSGSQWVSWIHRRDELNALRFLLENESSSGAYNLTAPEPVTNGEFGKTLAQVMGKPFWAPIPAFALKAMLGEMRSVKYLLFKPGPPAPGEAQGTQT